MIDLIDIVNSECMLCEAFADPRIYAIQQALKDKWHFIREHWNIQWDKIGPDQIEEVDHSQIEKMFKELRKVKAGKTDKVYICFAMYNEYPKYVLDYNMGNGSNRGIPLEEELFADLSKTYPAWAARKGTYNKINQSDMFNYFRGADYVIKIEFSGLDARKIQRQRLEDKKDMIPDRTKFDHQSKHLLKGELGKSVGGRSDIPSRYGSRSEEWGDSYYGYCQNLAIKVMQKYQNIAKSNRALKLIKVDDMDAKVKEYVNKVIDLQKQSPKLIENALAKLEDQRPISIKYKREKYVEYFKKLVDILNGRSWDVHARNGLLTAYAEFSGKAFMIEQELKDDISMDDWDMQEKIKDLDQARVDINNIIKAIDDHIANIKEKFDIV